MIISFFKNRRKLTKHRKMLKSVSSTKVSTIIIVKHCNTSTKINHFSLIQPLLQNPPFREFSPDNILTAFKIFILHIHILRHDSVTLFFILFVKRRSQVLKKNASRAKSMVQLLTIYTFRNAFIKQNSMLCKIELSSRICPEFRSNL